jgi:hypothetical protein
MQLRVETCPMNTDVEYECGADIIEMRIRIRCFVRASASLVVPKSHDKYSASKNLIHLTCEYWWDVFHP